MRTPFWIALVVIALLGLSVVFGIRHGIEIQWSDAAITLVAIVLILIVLLLWNLFIRAPYLVYTELLTSNALDHVVIGDGHRPLTLSVDSTIKGWPIMFPIPVRNTRTVSLQIVGYSVVIWGDNTQWHSFSWPGGNSLSSAGTNGVRPTIEVDGGSAILIGDDTNTIPKDDLRIIRIPIHVGQVPGDKPVKSPVLKVSGKLSLRCNQETREVDIPDYNFHPKLPQDIWEKVLNEIGLVQSG